MFCTKCGKENLDNAKFCTKCGERLTHNESQPVNTAAESGQGGA